MGRPSVKAERTEEILKAFERCVVRYGVDGATLERLADEAKLQRSLIRHYVGNRDDLLQALLDRFLAHSDQSSQLFFSSLPEEKPAQVMVDSLFDVSHSDSSQAAVGNALIVAANNNSQLRGRLKRWVDDFVTAVFQVLEQAYPGCSKKDCMEVAAGIVGIYFNVASVVHLGDMKGLWQDSKKAAERLLGTLSKKPVRSV